MKLWEKFTDEQLRDFVRSSTSYMQVAKKIGYNVDNGGGGITRTKEMIIAKGFDTTHFTGQGWNKNNFDYSRFRYGNNIKSADAVAAIIALRGHRCEKCLNELWQDVSIPLEVHHLDGDRLNNDLANLQLLCPNCHALTDNYCSKKRINAL